MFLKPQELNNKTALVTGAGKGIGKGCAIALAEAGADIITLSILTPLSGKVTCSKICRFVVSPKPSWPLPFAPVVKTLPVSVTINTFGTGKISDEELVNGVKKVFDLKPMGIINTLKLKSPIYTQLAAYGHFGREDSSWEQTDRVNQLKQQFGMEEISLG